MELLGWLVALAGTVPAVLQLVHTRRSGRTDGVSVEMHVVWGATWVGWLVYAAAVRQGPMVAQALAGLVLQGALLVELSRRGDAVAAAARRLVPAAGVWLAALPVVLACGPGAPVEGLAVALALADAVSVAPQTVRAWRDPSLAGVSGWSWAAQLGLSAGWAAYAVSVGHPLGASWSFVSSVAATVVLAGKVRRRGGPRPVGTA